MKLMGHAESVEHLGPRTTETTKFSIKSTNKAFEILSSKLYKDKIRAIIREVSCNAYDSHVAAGKPDAPFNVFLPSVFEPYLKIRDYGVGLSEDEMESLFTKFFESTKEDSNYFIGALGLGAKSPFSYVDSFTVISYQHGKRLVFECFKDEGIPHITKRSEVSSNEPVGVEVIIPVRPEDIDDFISRAQDVFGWFNPQPTIENNNQEFKHHIVEGFGSSGWSRFSNYHNYNSRAKVVAVMGQVAYDIDTALVGEEELRGVAIIFPIGDLDVQAGREELSYDKTTIANIQKRLTIIKDEIRLHYTKLFSQCENIFSAHYQYTRLIGGEPFFSCLVPTYRGHILSYYTIKTILQKYGIVSAISGPSIEQAHQPEDNIIFLSDRNDKRHKARLAKWCRENPEKFGYGIELRVPHDDPSLRGDINGAETVLSTDVPLPKNIAQLRAAQHNQVPRLSLAHSVSSDDRVGYILTRSLNWVCPKNPDKIIPNDIATSFHKLMKTENLFNNTSSYIPWSRKSIVSEEWTNLYTMLHERHTELTKNKEFVNKIRRARAWLKLISTVKSSWFERIVYIEKLPPSALTKMIERIIDCRSAYNEMQHWINYETKMEINRSPKYDLNTEWGAAKKQFPLFFKLIQPTNIGRYDIDFISDEVVFQDMGVYINSKISENKI